MAGPKAKEQPQKAKSEDHVHAEQAAGYFIAFIQGGKGEYRWAFAEIWDANRNNEDFVRKFKEYLSDSKDLQPLLKAYADRTGSADPKAIAEAVALLQSELRKPQDKQDQGKLGSYGPDFIKELQKVMASPAMVAKLPKEMMENKADQAAAALIAFIQGGKGDQREKFLGIWNEYAENDDFFNRFRENTAKNQQILDPLLIAYMKKFGEAVNPRDLCDAVAACYEELRKPPELREQARLDLYGPAFVKEMERIMGGGLLPIRVPSVADDQTLNLFLKTYSVKADGSSGREGKMRGLIGAVRIAFGLTDFTDASVLATAILQAYSMLSGEDRSMFISWLSTMDGGKSTSLAIKVITGNRARSISAAPYQLVRTTFESWKSAEETRLKNLSGMQQDLLTYPAHIREGNLDKLCSSFEGNPTDYGITLVMGRLEYVQKKMEFLKSRNRAGDSAEVAKLEAEVGSFKKWLSKLGLPNEKPMAGLNMIQAGLIKLQQDYYSMSPERSQPLQYLASVSPNKDIFIIYKRYLSTLDYQTGRFFSDVKPSDEDYITKAQKGIELKMSSTRIKRAQAQWNTDYYPMMSVMLNNNPNNPTMSQMVSRLPVLDPVIAEAFLEYLEVAKPNGLCDADERKLVVNTVAQLYAINPVLVVKYFQALKHLAAVCEDNSEAFHKAVLLPLAARVSVEASHVTSTTSPTAIFPIQERTTINNISRSLDQLMLISPAAVAQYERLNLADDHLIVREYQPHSIEQRSPPWAQSWLVDQSKPSGITTPYPFPQILPQVQTYHQFSGGAVTAIPQNYSGFIINPTFQPFSVFSGAGSAVASARIYQDPQHWVSNASRILPGSNISGLSMTRLLNEVNKAFIPTERPEYSGKILGGGGALGVQATPMDGKWNPSGAALGSVLTPTGGASLGGSFSGTSAFGGLAMSAVPVAIPLITGAAGNKSVTGIDTGLAGFEQLDDGTRNALLRVVQSSWNPNNPSQALIVLDGSETSDGKTFGTARYFFMNKEGMIMDLKGGQNDFVDVLNFAALYMNQPGNLPMTVWGNVEPTVPGSDRSGNTTSSWRGGTAVVIDLDKTPVLAHVQSVPFFMQKGTPQPFLLEWTGAVATTVGSTLDVSESDVVKALKKIGDETAQNNLTFLTDVANRYVAVSIVNDERFKALSSKDPALLSKLLSELIEKISKDPKLRASFEQTGKTRTTTIHSIAFPGQMLTLPPVIQVPGTIPIAVRPEQQFVLQGVDYTIRQIKGSHRWEVRAGGALAHTPIGLAAQGGVFLRYQDTTTKEGVSTTTRVGGGIFYQSEATNLQALALLQSAQDMQAYVESLHRIGLTIYGSTDEGAKYLLGGLAALILQLKQDQASGKISPDQFFYRFIGLLGGLNTITRGEIARFSGLDQLLYQYQDMASSIANNQYRPQAAATQIANFQQQYANTIQQVYDRYSLGMTVKVIGNDLSVEGTLISRETQNNFIQQVPDTAISRVLYTWDTGFWRAFSSIPMSTPGPLNTAAPGQPYIQNPQSPSGSTSGNITQLRSAGIVGTGIGQDMFDGFFAQRAAVDVGLLLARYESGPEAYNPSGNDVRQWTRVGWFAQGNIRLFSNILEDSAKYRRLVSDYKLYAGYIREGKLSKIPPEIRSVIVQGLRIPMVSPDVLEAIKQGTDKSIEDNLSSIKSGKFSRLPPELRKLVADGLNVQLVPKDVIIAVREGKDMEKGLEGLAIPDSVLEALKEGKNLPLQKDQMALIEDSLWANWFIDEKATLNRKFNGDVRVFLGAGWYHYDDRTYWDIGATIEIVDKLKAYVIIPKRDSPGVWGAPGVFVGADYLSGSWRFGIMGGAVPATSNQPFGGGIAASVGHKLSIAGVPGEVGITASGSTTVVPSYAAPFFIQQQQVNTYPNITTLMWLRFGSGFIQPANPNMNQPSLNR